MAVNPDFSDAFRYFIEIGGRAGGKTARMKEFQDLINESKVNIPRFPPGGRSFCKPMWGPDTIDLEEGIDFEVIKPKQIEDKK